MAIDRNVDSLHPDDGAAVEADRRLREIVSSLPISSAGGNVDREVLARVHRRRIAMRSSLAAALVGTIMAGWMATNDWTPQLPTTENHLRVESAPLGMAHDVQLFAVAFQGLPSPIVQLNTMESESQALLNYLSSFDALKEEN